MLARWLTAIVLLAVIVATSLSPWTLREPAAPEGLDAQVGEDQAWHAAMYAVLAAVLTWLLAQGRRPVLGAAGLAVGLAAGLGLGLELGQLFVVGRAAEPLDAIANLAGGLLGAIGSAGGIKLRQAAREQETPAELDR